MVQQNKRQFQTSCIARGFKGNLLIIAAPSTIRLIPKKNYRSPNFPFNGMIILVSLFMKLKVIEFTTLILAALVMGVFWGTWFTLTRSIPDFSATEFIHIGKTIIANVAVPMAILMPVTLLMML